MPLYYNKKDSGVYSVTVVHCGFDGKSMKYLAHGDELHNNEVRGLCEPSLTQFQKYYMTIRNDNRGYVTVSDDGLKWSTPKVWTFDDGKDLGGYNTQQHWVTHSDSLFLSYTRPRSGNNNHSRSRAPIFMARVDPRDFARDPRSRRNR